MDEKLLNSRGFRDEKHLKEFLDACKDESWKQELIDFFGLNKKESEKVEEEKTVAKTKSSKTK